MKFARALVITLGLAGLGACTVQHYQGPVSHPGYAPDSEYADYAGAPGEYYEQDSPRDSRQGHDGYDDAYADERDPRCNCRCNNVATRTSHVARRYEPDNPSAWLE